MKQLVFILLLVYPLSVFAVPNASIKQRPLQFIENKGQIVDQYQQLRSDIDFKLQQGDVTLFIGNGQLHYQWLKINSAQYTKTKRELSLIDDNTNDSCTTYRLDVSLIGANPNAEVITGNTTGYIETYYLPTTPNGATAKGYTSITYKNIYPKIDWELFVTTNTDGKPQLKYNFVVHPGGNPNDIRLEYNGATQLAISNGALIAQTPFGSVVEAAPYSYTQETKQEVPSKYQLSDNTLSFETGSYDGTLIIDPALEWATYYGGTSSDWFNALKVDSEGNIYACGNTISSNLATSGAYQNTNAGNRDGLIARFTEKGALVWATYYGGNAYDDMFALVIDQADNIYITGATYNSGLGAGNVHKPLFSTPIVPKSQTDALLIKMDATGQRIWSTYYGDTADDRILDIAIDTSNNLYLCGLTEGGNNIVTTGAHQTTITSVMGSLTDAVVAKFDTSGALIWGTYYGGNNYDAAFSISASKNGSICIGGRSNSSSGIATSAAHETTYYYNTSAYSYQQRNHKPFLALFDANGTRIWGTYYGNDTLGGLITGVCFDTSGSNVYAVGSTTDRSGITTLGSHQQSIVGAGQPGFITKFNASGIRQWGTYYGGDFITNLSHVMTTPQNRIIVLGTTFDSTHIATQGSMQDTLGGQTDLLISQFSPDGEMIWGSYFGGLYGESSGSNNSQGNTDFYNHKIFFNVRALSQGLATPGAAQDTLLGSFDAMLVCMYADTVVSVHEPFADTALCPGDTVLVPYDVSYHFYNGNTFTVQLSDSGGSFNSPITIGSRVDSLADTIQCIIPKNIIHGTSYRLRIIATAPAFISSPNEFNIRIQQLPSTNATNNGPACEGGSITLTTTGISNASYTWAGPNAFSSQSASTTIQPAQLLDTGFYYVKVEQNGCANYDTTHVSINPKPDTPTAASNTPVCRGTSLMLYGNSTSSIVNSYRWLGPNSFADTNQNPIITNSAYVDSGSYKLYVIDTNGCASDTAYAKVEIGVYTPNPSASSNSPLCIGEDLQLTAANISNATYSWFNASYTASVQNPIKTNVLPADSGVYYVTASVNGCVSDTDSVVIVIKPQPEINVSVSPDTMICNGEQAIFTASATNTSNTPQYLWFLNGVSTSNTTTFYSSTALSSGDIIYCQLTDTSLCSVPVTESSNAINMRVLSYLAPSVTITANPNTPLVPLQPITFTATPVDAGANPTYQWTRNGIYINGATSDVWSANANFLSDGDDICVILYSDYLCPNPDSAISNCFDVQITSSVNNINLSNIKIFPNPTNEHLYIEGAQPGSVATLYDVTGRSIYTKELQEGKNHINLSRLAKATYLLQIADTDGNRFWEKITIR